MDQAGVVADMGVGEDQPGERCRRRMGREQVELLREVGGGIDDLARASRVVDQGEAGDQATLRRVGPGARAGCTATTRLGHAAILRAAQQ